MNNAFAIGSFMLQCFLGAYHRLKFFVSNNTWFAVGLVLAVVGTSLKLLRVDTFLDWIGVVIAGVGLLGLAVAISERLFFVLSGPIRLEPKFPPIGLLSALRKAGWEQQSYKGSMGIFNTNLNRALWAARNPIALSETPFKLSSTAIRYYGAVFRELRLRWDTINESKIRLCTELTTDRLAGAHPLTLQRTDYFSGLATNHASHLECCTPRHVCELRGSTYYFEQNELVSLEASGASNHIGVNTLAVTRDRMLIYHLQGPQVVGAHKLAASASGSLDWQDIDRCRRAFARTPSFFELLAFGVERELVEEIGATTLTGGKRTIPTGFARMLDRGGKPDFYFLTYLHQDSSELRRRRQEWRRVKEIRMLQVPSFESSALVESLTNLHSSLRSREDVTLHLLLSLAFAIYRLKEDSANVRNIFA
jgi:hypothetical protein